ncbi:rap guanine nucleotide exchange factor 1-like isoform X2 [Gigantopelta aegis]|uniref:rap guanine nucleotide exchange factor 1-like isoform X2 n=1 Tax=Gigantopelta aegis TaxID=1735272 RepID=UPI001B88B2EE|nr:rap guanine nucleotide exchange factor 1-like isoform X2 [Gigantopelta aegis]
MMSGRSEKTEKSSGSKMLKKARSFREDIKCKIKRRPSSGAQQMIPDPKPKCTKTSKHMSRTSSMSDGLTADEDTEKDAGQLQLDVDELNRTLTFITMAVINKEKFEILPALASKVLENIMSICTMLSNLLMNQDSTKLLSGHNNVCQCLARFIRWSDSVFLNSKQAQDKDNANEIITALSEGVKDLSQLCIDKMANRKSSLPKSPGMNNGIPSHSENGKRQSLPDIPLTPRERQILKQTSELGIYDNASITVSRSSDSISNQTMFTFEESPPPKPPLPQTGHSIIPRLPGCECAGGDGPPPLPEKEKRRSHQSLIDSMSSSTSSCSRTPTQSPHDSVLMNPALEQSYSSGLTTPLSNSTHSISPLNQSPASSTGSGLNQSHEHLVCGDPSEFGGHSFPGQQTSSFSSRSISLNSNSSRKQHTSCDQINLLTGQIQQLTSSIDEVPPPLPSKRFHRMLSTYDNLPDGVTGVMSATSLAATTSRTVINKTESRFSSSSTSSSQSSQSSGVFTQKSSSTAIYTEERASSQETYSSSETFSSATSHSSMESLPKGMPPPLPPKKAHIHDYMRTFGSYTQPSSLECISRHSINFYEAQWHQHQIELFQPMYPRSNTISVISDISNLSSDTSFSSGSPDHCLAIPALPLKIKRFDPGLNRQSLGSTCSSNSDVSNSTGELRDKSSSVCEPPVTVRKTITFDPKRLSAPAHVGLPVAPLAVPEITPAPVSSEETPQIQKDADSDFAELNPLDDVDVSDQLIRKKPGEDGPDIRGGFIDPLVVHATVAGKSEFIYQEAFLTTYRTFISPKNLIEKLLYRFYKFQHATDNKKRLGRNSFSLLIRVVDELGCMELDDEVVKRMMDLVFELISQGELIFARILRNILIEKCEKRQHSLVESNNQLPIQSINLSQSLPDLLHFKSHDIAEQMTLLDAELFQKIEIPEVLLWAKEQSEELSPNLTHFTEHFNKMSYWCRTKILTQDDPKEREKCLIKFIKIMKHLRKMANFNSYLAILSALDSAPVRRLEWQKQNLEALKEFCQLIDSSSSFRAYRQALSETEPPCIPYLGLILQDLTFVKIGNQDLLPDGSINMAKRWQQFNILDGMRRFKKCNYGFKRSEKIQQFFNNFDNYLSEETLWQISQKIKPRDVKKRVEVDS